MKYQDYKTKFSYATDSDIYDAIYGTNSKAAKKGGISPAEQLLRDANFIHMKKDDRKKFLGSMYPHILAFCLK